MRFDTQSYLISLKNMKKYSIKIMRSSYIQKMQALKDQNAKRVTKSRLSLHREKAKTSN